MTAAAPCPRHGGYSVDGAPVRDAFRMGLRMRFAPVALLLGALVAAHAANAASAASDARADGAAGEAPAALTGHWRLDAERSDDALDALDDAARDVAGDLRAPRSRRPDPAGLRRSVGRGRLGRELFAPLRLPARTLELEVAGNTVAFGRDGGPPERLWTDGRPSVVDAANPDARTAAWEDGVLWVERSSARGTRVIEAWRREGATLRGAYEIRNGLLEDPVRFTLVFVPLENE